MRVSSLNRYFNVTNQDVMERLLMALKGFSSQFQQITEQNPDLYGPFWIYTTLIFMLSAMGNIANWIKGNTTAVAFGDIEKAAVMIYVIGFLVPLLLSFIMKVFGSQTPYVQILCIYGYSFTCILPASLCALIPIGIFQWVIIIGAGVR